MGSSPAGDTQQTRPMWYFFFFHFLKHTAFYIAGIHFYGIKQCKEETPS